mmetsp:Transcript_17266/g.25019  ORF Transcript_17266/g.25019 Transcript_17266/m.25019 type:complete len:188 (-) Transcript_17266:193-756(-)|eukprot:CAMPEP_0170074330 /NCGR_PEP_ID=MMETSP0019_2-20121128/11638_1 /TAXON_ID=98059 /ORGANISM="Dinobryon sp., Strain UTEXLB2267" /LENGTH=187 /DNA_ID=CAMNT_0010284533 /DNA_START=105 /DNA_END=668 /DNA_ORIENTATION=+
MDDTNSALISAFDSSARVLYGSLVKTPALMSIISHGMSGSEADLNWTDVMNGFTMVSKQLESLYMDIQPDAFSMSIVTPKDIVINQPTLLPQLLITSLPKEETDAINVPDPLNYSLSSKLTDYIGDKQKLEDDLKVMVERHNQHMNNILDAFNNNVDEWKKTIQTEQKKRRYDHQKASNSMKSAKKS